MFEWKPDYALNIKSIDAQHQNLFAIGRELHAAMAGGRGKAVMSSTLDRLAQYTASHFAHEEGLMKLYKYPGLAKHKAEHDALIKKVQAFQADFKSGTVTSPIQVLEFVKDWLQHHIKESDSAYAPWLKERKAS